MHAVRRLTPGMCRQRSVFENHPAAAFGGGGQACNVEVFDSSPDPDKFETPDFLLIKSSKSLVYYKL